MQHLLTIREQDINPGSPEVDASGFSHREAARAVVLGEAGAIALLAVTRHGYYKLPGGGLEDDEDARAALARETNEEIGCDVQITNDVGVIIEQRDKWAQIQTSYCYLATKVGEQREPSFTEQEIADGFEVVWADDIDAAIAMTQAKTPEKYGEKFMQKRDLAFLVAARSLLRNR